MITLKIIKLQLWYCISGSSLFFNSGFSCRWWWRDFNYAKNELDILYSKSVGNKKLRAILNYSGSFLMTYDQISFYDESDEFIKFVDNTFDISGFNFWLGKCLLFIRFL